MARRRSGLLLDACAVINFAASRRFEELAEFCSGFGIVSAVADEVHFVRRGGTGEDADVRESIDLLRLTAEGLLEVELNETAEELASFVEFAVDLGDGEAMTLAIAQHRGRVVITDDRKAARIAGEAGIEVISTLEIVHNWCNSAKLDADAARDALLSIRERGRYVPHRQHPFRHWWDLMLEEG